MKLRIARKIVKAAIVERDGRHHKHQLDKAMTITARRIKKYGKDITNTVL